MVLDSCHLVTRDIRGVLGQTWNLNNIDVGKRDDNKLRNSVPGPNNKCLSLVCVLHNHLDLTSVIGVNHIGQNVQTVLHG